MNEPTISAELQGPVVVLTFTNISYGNSFGLSEAEQLKKILDQYKNDIDGLLFCSGHSSIFCSGGNLKKYKELSEIQEGKNINQKISGVFDELESLSCATCVLVSGDCLGGGIELISTFDQVLATPAAMFGFWQRRIGLSFGWGGGRRLEKRMSSKRLSQLMLAARSLSVYEALNMGLVDEVVPAVELESTGQRWLKNQIQLPKIPVDTIKSFNSKKEGEQAESLWGNPDHQKALGRNNSVRRT